MLTLSTTLSAALAAGNPQRVLLEFPDDSGEVFSNEEIVMSRGVRLNAPFCAEKELTVGMCPSTEIQFSLLNDVRQLSTFTFGECKAWMGARLNDGVTPAGTKYKTFVENGTTWTYEFAPLGIFVVERPDIVQVDIIDITANDRMVLFDEEFDGTGITYPTTLLGLAQNLCQQAGVTLATQTFMNYDLAIQKKSKQFENRTMREILKWIAEAAGSIARFNRSGQLEITWFQTTNVTYTGNRYKEFTPCWYKVKKIDSLKVRNAEETSESSCYPPGSQQTNPYVIAGNPFLR